ncbi:hypothetical protein [Algisphaera agarilytica]|uniref:Uncharacterized protein n=1 Tax=Algisphaera agarilytica TaxID=1385975 RepID=A0A7X0HB50_9BACT|nr:hypothetical protein [Algisphaera agarilytica]MBB6431496.1 hypothetical protein [Algisphaera agarilytica]
MMFRPNPAVRWCLLSLALCLLFAAPTERRGSAAHAAEPPATSTTPAATESPAKPPAVTGLPKDLNDLTREELIALVKDLTLQNQVMAVSLAEQRQALEDAAPDLQARIDWQARTIERLRGKLAKAEAQLEQAKTDAATQTPTPGQTPADPKNPDAAPESSAAWEYRFAYEFGLIRTSGSGKTILRDENGKRQRHEFDYSEYRRDAIWANVFLRNDSETPMRFSGIIELQGDKPFGNKQPRERLGNKAFRTPLLQPGEVFQLSEDEIFTERPWKVDIIEITEVNAYEEPAEPAPDAG